MREYIFYVFLVFLPIGALMVKILYDHGLPIKNIAYIVLTSLAIVITFPISMERLGVLLAFTVYAILILLIILYMVKTADNVSLDAVASSAVSDNKIEIDNKKEPNHKDNLALDTKISDNSDKQFQSVLTVSFEQEE
ncbi:MAG: hypothetical protein GX790_01585, partial [Syntrophomonadaceae bacterium]|nr:hypothetical protein [Syntrophomonadaceae bacterium]